MLALRFAMSLRLRLFLLLAALVVVLVGTQAVLVRALAARLDENVRTVAFQVGERILSGFRFESGGSDREGDRHKVLVVTSGDAAPRAPAPVEGGAAEASGTELRWVLRHEVELREGEDGTAGGEALVHEKRITLSGDGAPPPHEELVRRLALEPGAEPDVLFLRGASAHPQPIPIPRAPVASTLEAFRSRLIAGSLAVLAVGLLAAAVVAHRATRPLGELARAARRVGDGELGVEVAARRHDEVGVALEAFNEMSRRLAALDRENRRLAESERLSELGEVARGLAHTLRNPLNALGLSLEQLAAGGADAGRAPALVESSRRQIRRMDGALRSFLALASAGGAAPERVDLVALAREVALEALQDAAGRVRVEVQAPAGRLELQGVAAELRAALQALVVNACEASPEGERVEVAVAAAAGGRVRFTVEDRGAGLSPEVARRLFEPHVTTKPNGSGIGLFLAQRIAAGRYGGAVEVVPRPGGGTRATLEVGDRIGGAA